MGEPGVWVWRAAWHDATMYAVGYATGEPRFARLYRSTDGVDREPWVPVLFADGYPNESGLVVAPDGTAFCLLRRDGDDATAQLGRALPPYREWSWMDLGVRVGGPRCSGCPTGGCSPGYACSTARSAPRSAPSTRCAVR
ncbi:hypothetical protein NKG94_10165 [Micromonospora sp. M12]